MHTQSLLTWSEPVTEFIGFASLFLANGAIGFRYAAVRDRLSGPSDPDRNVYTNATQRAGLLGLIGTVVQVILLVRQLPHLAERMHLSTGQLVTTDPETAARCLLLALAFIGFGMVASQRWGGWPIAAIGLIGAQLAVILGGRWIALVNPLHQMLASLWLGTLLILVIAGLSIVMREAVGARRGPVVADMVNGFSPLALICAPLLVLTGVITAVLHLKPFSSLWTTPYGYALLTKLCLVALVFGLGTWNWRRQRPRLGSEEAATSIRRSARMELSAAALVLIVTAILVSLPSPNAPRPGGAAPPAETSDH